MTLILVGIEIIVALFCWILVIGFLKYFVQFQLNV
jgi:hypothetical protein